jgi:hypothetical protein
MAAFYRNRGLGQLTALMLRWLIAAIRPEKPETRIKGRRCRYVHGNWRQFVQTPDCDSSGTDTLTTLARGEVLLIMTYCRFEPITKTKRENMLCTAVSKKAVRASNQNRKSPLTYTFRIRSKTPIDLNRHGYHLDCLSPFLVSPTLTSLSSLQS